jgi:membrane dipeptidase
MMVPGWIPWATMPFDKDLKIEQIALHIDHIAQLAGSVRHIGIGSDLDGGYGTEQTPMDLKSIADLQKLVSILQRRGYSQADIAAIMHGNWIRKLGETLPE